MKIKNILREIVVKIITFEARLVLKRYNPKIIAVTGSVGKTSTKDAIYTIMSGFFNTRKSEKSFNSEIGLPLTILGCKNAWNNPILWSWNILKGFWLIIFPHNYPDWLILEVGADKPGDIRSVSEWLKTDVVVVTRIAEIPVHIEKFKDQKEVVKEKGYLIKTLKNNGVLILNNDDPSIIKFKDKTKNKVITFGFEKDSNIMASNYHIVYEDGVGSVLPHGIAFKIDYLGSNVPVRLNNIFGKQNVYTALAAFSAGSSQGLNLLKMIEVLREHSGPPGRFRPLKGIKGTIIIDDTYNSSPVALEMAIQSFSEIKSSGKKIAVLGDMLELGIHTEDAHIKIGEQIPSVFDMLVTVGERARFFEDGARKEGMKKENIFHFEDSFTCGQFVESVLSQGDAVLIKGSQGIRMEKVVYAVVSDEEKMPSKLVRQEDEWKKR